MNFICYYVNTIECKINVLGSIFIYTTGYQANGYHANGYQLTQPNTIIVFSGLLILINFIIYHMPLFETVIMSL